jgi:hypothetical protein
MLAVERGSALILDGSNTLNGSKIEIAKSIVLRAMQTSSASDRDLADPPNYP